MIRLNKISLFLTGFLLIAACYFIRQLDFINGSEQAKGRLYIIENLQIDDPASTELTTTIVVFNTGKQWVAFEPGQRGALFAGDLPPQYIPSEEVPVIYKKSDPVNAKPYTFFGFWFENIAYFLVPLFIWAAFSLSYLDKGESLTFNFRDRAFGKSLYREDPKDKHFPSDGPGRKRLE